MPHDRAGLYDMLAGVAIFAALISWLSGDGLSLVLSVAAAALAFFVRYLDNGSS